MFKRIIYIAGNQPFTARDEQRFGVVGLTRLGYEISVFDCSAWMGGDGIGEQDLYQGATTVNDAVELFVQLEELDRKSTLIVCRFRSNVAVPVWRYLAHGGFRIAVFNLANVPKPHAQRYERSEELLHKVKLLPRRLYHMFRMRRHPAVDYYLYGGRVARYSHQFECKLTSATQFISAHTCDYESYRELRDSKQTVNRGKEIIAFIDQNFFSHPDFEHMGEMGAPILDTRYSALVQEMLHQLEVALGCEAVICAHPSSDESELKQLYGQHRVIKGRSLELVSQARLVISHYSTLVGVALLSDCPVLLFVSDSFRAHKELGIFQGVFEKMLEIKAYQIEKEASAEEILGLCSKPGDVYKRWINDYIKEERSPDYPLWKIFSDAISERSDLEKNS